MRTSYRTEDFDFDNLPGFPQGNPQRIVIHRMALPERGAPTINVLRWGNRESAFSIHDALARDGTVYQCIAPNKHAYHVKESRKARDMGYPIRHAPPRQAWAARGDVRAIGIECRDEVGGAPGQQYSFAQELRISLVLRVADHCRDFPELDPRKDIFAHADFDPWTRPADVGDALNLDDFREDVADALARRTPWRTVQEFATGARAPDSWRPDPENALQPPPVAAPQPNAAYGDGYRAAISTLTSALTNALEQVRQDAP